MNDSLTSPTALELVQNDVLRNAAAHNEEELARMVRVLDFAEEMTIFFARCNTPLLRRQLIDEATARLAAMGIRVVEIVFEGAIILLRQKLRAQIAEAIADGTDEQAGQKIVLFIQGLDYSIPYNEPAARILAELNLGREFFLRDVPHPFVLWLPDYAVTAVARHAPDFWSWRSGVFEFETGAQERRAAQEQIVRPHDDWLVVDNMTVAQKERRRRILEGILDDYERLPANQSRRGELISVLSELGKVNFGLDAPEEAINYWQRVLSISRKVGDRQYECYAIDSLGMAYSDLGKTEQAIKYHQQALAISREINDHRRIGNALNNLGMAYRLRDKERAAYYLKQAVAQSVATGDRRGEGMHLGNLGLVYSSSGRIDLSIEYDQRALIIFRELGDRRNEGVTLGSLGVAYENLGQVEEAKVLWREALAIFEALESPHAEWVRGLLAKVEDE